MVSKPFVGVLIYILAFSVLCQDFNFERVVECQNNDFQVVEESTSANQQTFNNQRSIIDEESLEKLHGKLQALEQMKPIKKTVRCKKWVESYKIVQKANLRKDSQTQPDIIYQQTRKPLDALNKRGLFTPLQSQQTQTSNLTPEQKLTSTIGRSSSTSDQQQVAQLMSLYYHYTLMNDIIVYGSQYSSLVAA